jgi:hypothetical protein
MGVPRLSALNCLGSLRDRSNVGTVGLCCSTSSQDCVSERTLDLVTQAIAAWREWTARILGCAWTRRILIMRSRPDRWMAVTIATTTLATALLVVKPTTVVAQQKLVAQTCARCSLTISESVKLQGADLTGEPSSLAMDAAGRIFLAQFQHGAEILVFGPDGLFQRTIGRSGQGPGEFRSIRALTVRLDSLYVIDVGNARLSVLTTSGVFVRSVPVPFTEARLIALQNPTIALVTGAFHSADAIGLPLHELDLSTGRVVRSFGNTYALVNPQLPWLELRATALGEGGAIWSARQTAYEIERWSPEGHLLGSFNREAAWFRPYVERPIGTNKRPPPWLMAVTPIGGSELLVAVANAAENFTELLGPKLEQYGGMYYDIGRRRLLYNTILEVIDVERYAVISHVEIDDYVIGFVPGTQWAYTYDEVQGVPLVEMIRITFTGDGGSSR